MATTKPTHAEDDTPLVEVVDRPEDIVEGFDCVAEAFGRQARDAIWIGMNPGWDTPAGRAAGAARLVERWRATAAASEHDGRPGDTVFLKATVAVPDPGGRGTRRAIAGLAIWVQMSAVEGRGAAPSDELGSSADLEALHPGDGAAAEAERRHLRQAYRSLVRRRGEVVRAKAAEEPPCLMVLDMCATDPAFQRRGVASALVRWGLDEARRRGVREAAMEASSMGRLVYERMGFRPDGPDIVYEVDAEFQARDRPPNVFMRRDISA